MAEPCVKVGNVEIIALLDVNMTIPTAMMFPAVPAEAWEPYKQKYPYAFAGKRVYQVL